MNSSDLIEIFDTTLRDGTQGEGVNLSVQDKLIIAQRLDEFGIDVIEGGWPGSNPRDEEFFQLAKKVLFANAQLNAFGSTARAVDKVKSDINLNSLLAAETPTVTIFGKTWKLHSEKSLGISDTENEQLIYESVMFLKERGRRVIYDAEHFFDGFKDNPEFAFRMLRAAEAAGADVLTLCDTNGGTLPGEIFEIVSNVKNNFSTVIGIHSHNDSDLAVANALVAVKAGARHIQGTINGVGERCGNANLCSIIPNLMLKLKMNTVQNIDLESLTSLSHFVCEVMNLNPNTRAPYVGNSAFAHKGGIHVSAVIKDSRMYEHISPKLVGNQQRVLVSDLSGQSNIRYKAKEIGVDLDKNAELAKKVVDAVKTLEHQGYQFEGAEASFELILRSKMNEFKPFFTVQYSKINVVNDIVGYSTVEVVLKIEVNGEIEHTASEGNGPVNALDKALRKALLRFYPEIALMKLMDYKVRVIDEKDGTGANVRVIIQSGDGEGSWSTVGVSVNIIEASIQALCDSMNYGLFRHHKIHSKQTA